MRPAISTMLAAACALALLQGCQQGQPAPTPTASLGPGDEYVAFGDSYTAAPVTGPLDGNDGCLRSERNYPHLVARSTGADLVDASCSGATTDSIVHRSQAPDGQSVAPQIDALSGGTDLVTVGIGANDLKLLTVLLTCVGLAAEEGEHSTPCRDRAASTRAAFESQISTMEDHLTARLGEIADRAPNALVLVIGYPSIFPAEGSCDLLPLAPGDYPFARWLLGRINDALRSAAGSTGAEYVETASGTAGHDACAKEPWVAGAEAPRGHAMPWHPYPEEQQYVAEQIVDALG